MRVAVVGAGLAGLAAGCELADGGHEVTLFEKRPWAGGKTYSFVDRETGEAVDNGQHIAMRCTTAYVAFLEKLGGSHLVRWQKRLRVPVIDASGRRSVLRADPVPLGLHLGPSFALYRHLSVGDKMRVARGILAIQRSREHAEDADLGFAEWLQARGQSESAIAGFWDLIVVPALNCRCDDVSASQAMFVFREGFLKSAESAAIGVPTVGLSALHVEPAMRYIEARGGEFRMGRGVVRFDVRDNAVENITLADGESASFDAYVSALPPRQLLDALPAELADCAPFAALRTIRMSPIVNLHLWFDAPIADFEFAAFTGCDLQWAFRPSAQASSDDHVVLSLSAADRLMPMDKRELLDLLLPQLQRALPATNRRKLLRSALIKEPDATFVPSPGLRRPGVETPLRNMLLAGAYTDTGWPATMESAVRSGIEAAHAVQRNASSITPRREAVVA